MIFIKLRTGTYYSTQVTGRTMCLWCNSAARSRYHFLRGKEVTITCWIRIIRILSRQPASPRASCFWHQNAGTQSNQNARELPECNFSSSRVWRTKQKKRENGPGVEKAEIRTSSEPSKCCQISHATYECLHVHKNFVLCILGCVLCTVHCELCTVYFALWTV